MEQICPECSIRQTTEEAHCELHMRAPAMVEALVNAKKRLERRNEAPHEPLEETIKRIDRALGEYYGARH